LLPKSLLCGSLIVNESVFVVFFQSKNEIASAKRIHEMHHVQKHLEYRERIIWKYCIFVWYYADGNSC